MRPYAALYADAGAGVRGPRSSWLVLIHISFCLLFFLLSRAGAPSPPLLPPPSIPTYTSPSLPLVLVLGLGLLSLTLTLNP